MGFFTDLLVADILSIPSVAKYAVTKSLQDVAREGWMGHVSCRPSSVGASKMAISNFQLVCAVAVVAIATFVNLPAPRFSERLEEWRNMGQYFNYKGNAIFYQGEFVGANISGFACLSVVVNFSGFFSNYLEV